MSGGKVMSVYEWNEKVEYLQKSRGVFWNTDYLEFLIHFVWKIKKPVHIADFGCGLGYLGSIFLPLLPEGSTYTGFDKGKTLIDEAKKIFEKAPFKTNFIEQDLLTYEPKEKFDVVMCQAVLMHIPNSANILKKMISSTKTGGLVICSEINWNVTNAAFYIDGIDTNRHCNLGVLQKLWVEENNKNNIDRCIGVKIPVFMQKLGLSNVGIRMNDCVQFVNPHASAAEHEKHLTSFLTGGWDNETGEKSEIIDSLCKRGLTEDEATCQYECEKEIHDFVRKNKNELYAVHAPSMFISYGTV